MKTPSSEEQNFITEHINDDVNQLALLLSKRNDIDKEYIIRQISGFQIVKKKIPSWYPNISLMLPHHLALEQCSSEHTAKHKASLCSGKSICDLTGGLGVDFLFMSKNFETATYIEQQEYLCQLMQHNSKVLNLHNIEVVNADSKSILDLNTRYSCIYIDPARRSSSGSKTVLLTDCQPDLSAIYNTLLDRCDMLIAKLSPMLDISISLNQLPHTSDIHVVSVENECKELIFISSPEDVIDCKIHCINIIPNKQSHIFCFTRKQEHDSACTFANEPEAYIYEPNASILKAGAYKSIASRLGIKKIAPHSHLYTSNELIDNFPGRTFRMVAWFIPSKAMINEHLNGIKFANISTRNYPCTVAELRNKLRIKEGGDCYLFATTLSSNKKVIIRCEKLHRTA